MKNLLSSKNWSDCGVPEELKEILISKGFKKPSRIQAASLAFFVKKEEGNLLGQAKNGSGKTLSFLLPSIIHAHQELQKTKEEPALCSPFVVILADTKDLCMQIQEICDSLKFPGIETDFQSKDSEDNVNEKSHITIATSSRLFYMLKKKMISLKRLKLFIIDECDKIIDNDRFGSEMQRNLKFIPDSCRFGLFSATMAPEVVKKTSIFKKTFAEITFKNKEDIVLKNLTHYFVQCQRRNKLEFMDKLLNEFLENMPSGSVIIFTNTKNFAEIFAKKLQQSGHKTEILLGDMDIEDKKDIMKEFKQGKLRILITTNILSRGIDNRKVGLVVNLDLPILYKKDRSEPVEIDEDTYFHRVGRTGRFGDYGLALNVVDSDELMSEMTKFGMKFGMKLIEISNDNVKEVIEKTMQNTDINKVKRETLNEDNI